MARYHFVTEIVVGAPLERTWEHVADPTRWPAAWRWLASAELLDGATPPLTLGDRSRYAFRTALPYTLSFVTEVTEIVPPTLIVVDASGELAGTGRWELADVPAGTALRYTWLVETTKRWMNLLAPIARPAFSWNHDVLMKDFARGLASALDAPLVSVDNHTVAPGSPGFGRADTPA